ncbi:MAG: hypothetical protein NTY19_08570 [Planctomycetota bacterium]|nr:hypothetical protein [Planctomycetota bacterium]
MDDFPEDLALAMVVGAIVAGPVLSWWPLVGILAAVGTALYIASRPKR